MPLRAAAVARGLSSMVTERTLCEPQQPNLCTGADQLDMAHRQELTTLSEYAYATTDSQLQRRSAGKTKARIPLQRREMCRRRQRKTKRYRV